ncbi:hypothetical protein CRV08_05620 [Halarcobacter ebronensis]|uniref:Iron transporter n=1 Tax=Halarcobacter ebronensis TaxID=1462615 RepID=A0A4Q0YFJ0_9BACT|nr:hypothetical protein [Halarcobacter ebronensis]RXJ68915.1 hypothetical protein CRV08_05620 [Halarcobacter ebronensis]
MNTNRLFKKDNNSNLGFIRLFFGIIGSLVTSYLAIIFIAKQLHFSIFENIVVGITLLPFIWSIFALWIIYSSTKFYAILKTFSLSLFFIFLLMEVN